MPSEPVITGHRCRESPDPRKAGRCACGRKIDPLTSESIGPIESAYYRAIDEVADAEATVRELSAISFGMRDRDIELERYLTSVAAQAHGYTETKSNGTQVGYTRGLDDFSDRRAHPGGVRAEMDYDLEMAEEIADARNYAVWGIEPIWTDVRAGESRHTADYERRMRALGFLVAAWHALHDVGP